MLQPPASRLRPAVPGSRPPACAGTPPPAPRVLTSLAGFTLVEVLVSTALVAGALAALAQLMAAAITLNAGARARTAMTVLAAQKVEELRSLEWGVGDLASSPAGALSRDAAAYADYLDAGGRPLGATAGTGGATYVRRWAIEPLAGHEERAIVLQVIVLTLPASRRTDLRSARAPDRVRLVSLKTRRYPGS